MSSFVVADKTINRVLGYLELHAHTSRFARLLQDTHSVSLDDLGAKMFALNVKGTSTRYPNDPLEDLPGEIGHTAYAGYEYKLADQFQAVKSLRCFLYQCAEGDVPQDELYKALADLLHEWALEIVSRLPDYERAEWD